MKNIIVKSILSVLMTLTLIIIPRVDFASNTIALGDINEDGRKDTGDILEMLKHISATESNKNKEWILTGDKFKAADINQDNKIDVVDILRILKYIAANKDAELANRHKEWLDLGEIQKENNEPAKIEASAIKMSENVNINKGKVGSLKVTVIPSNAVKPELKWTSSNTKVATVDAKTGKITTISKGTTKITAVSTKNSKVTATCVLNVTETEVKATEIKLNKTALEIERGKTEALIATINPSTTTNKNITWSSSNTKIVTVNNGTIKAIAVGTANITAKTSNGKVATCKITVKDPMKSLTVKANGKNIVSGSKIETNKDQLIPLLIMVNPSDSQITFKSSNEKIAKVDKNGNIRAINRGKTTITVTAKTKTEMKTIPFTINVNVPVKKVQLLLNKKEVKKLTISIGESQSITSSITPTNSTDKKVTWSTSNKKVATVNNGKITAKGVGTATITAKSSNGKKATCKVTVKDPIKGVTIKANGKQIKSGATVTLDKGKSMPLTIKTTPSNAKITVKSENTKIAKIDNKANIKAVNGGTTKITVKITTKTDTKAIQFKVKVNIPVEKVSILYNDRSVNGMTITKGSSISVYEYIYPSNATNKKVKWTSSDSNVAIINNGKISAVGKGTATIKLTSAENSKKYSSFDITVKESVERIELNKSELTLNKGSYETIQATVTPSDAMNPEVYWSSSNSEVAKVENGTISAISNGTAIITAQTKNGKMATCVVKVQTPLNNMILSAESLKINLGKSAMLRITADPIDASNISKIGWQSSNKNVAYISSSSYKNNAGTLVITGKKVGEAIITIKVGTTNNDEGITKKIYVKVSK